MPIPRPDPGLHFVGGHPGVDFPRALGRVVQRGCRQASVLISDYGFCFTVFRNKKKSNLQTDFPHDLKLSVWKYLNCNNSGVGL